MYGLTGGEAFRGAFARYLERLGTRLLLTLPNNPRANGLVEHINGLIANGLHKMLLALPGVALEDALVDVLAGLHQLPTRLGWQPFLLVFKQYPRCLTDGLGVPPPPLAAALDEETDK